MTLDLVSKGIKGAWVEQSRQPRPSGGTRKLAGQTILHIPFIEGAGVGIKSRNLHRNFGVAIKRLLVDSVFGLGQGVDSFTFDEVILELDELGLRCDFTLYEEEKVIDILNQLLIVRGMYLRRQPSGTWAIYVDKLVTSPTATFGYGDGVYNNIIDIESLATVDTADQVKELKLDYQIFPSSTGELKPNASIVRRSDNQGVETKQYSNKYILDDETADRGANYLANKFNLQKTSITFTSGQEARWLVVGDVVKIVAPVLGLTADYFKVVRVKREEGVFTIKALKYTSKIYQYTPGPFPLDVAL